MKGRRIIGLGLALIMLVLAGCSGSTVTKTDPAKDTKQAPAAAATGEFDWKRESGKSIHVLLNKHPYAEWVIKNLPQFESMTGIKVTYEVIPEQNYFDKVTVSLSSGSGTVDAFMTGAYQVWQYAPPGYMQPLEDFINNKSLTSPDWDFNDFYPNIMGALRWSLKAGEAVGTGHQWAIPMAFETNVLMYRKDLFEKHNIKVPKTMPELYETAKKLNNIDGSGIAGIAVRGSRNWGTIHPGYMTTFANYGAKDFNDKLEFTGGSDKGVAMTDLWAKMIKEAGPKAWSQYTWYEAGSDFGAGKAAMLLDADILGYFQDVEGGSPLAGQNKIAWAPPPVPEGHSGQVGANLWIWSLAMNSKSTKKDATWLFMQWATSKEIDLQGALQAGTVDPARKSVWENADFKKKLATKPGYYETFQTIINGVTIHFTPQPKFFETTTEWAATLQDIVGGKDTKQAMADLTKKINSMMDQAGLKK
ncbi:MAG TPA: sugar ABC transporter substrate-binding protein [Symbiobacteriaceae bacterium]|nr:sugar ABC transporter substrate-binding protein [Symbiobacteriaceae bacterium]